MPEYDGLIYAPLTVVRSPQLGTPDDEELKLINKIAPEPQTRDGVFVVPGTASTNALDSYWTRMDPKSSLPNFVRDLRAGAGLMDSHDTYRLPVGMSYHAELLPVEGGKAEGAEATDQVFGRWYVLRNHDVPGSGNTESYIRGIQGGTIRKLSIGFGGSEMTITCDEDGRDIWDWDSPYWPGQVLDDGRRVTYTVRDARLYETSMVYKNATPGALIARMQTLISERRINSAEAYRLARATGHRFDVPAPQHFMGGNLPLGRDAPMAIEARTLLTNLLTRKGAELSAKNRATLEDLAKRAGDSATNVQDIADELAALITPADDTGNNAALTADQRAAIVALGEDANPARITELRRNAEAGKKYRDNVIGAIVTARTAAALGADGQTTMNQERQEAIRASLALQPIDDLEELAQLWDSKRADKFVGGPLLRFSNPPEGTRNPADEDDGGFLRIREG